jgi:hypothetical protein
MAKPGLTATDIASVLRSAASTAGWSLCVGAGTSRGAFPTWDGLVETLFQAWVYSPGNYPVEDPASLISILRKESAADALIQAAQDRLLLDDNSFALWLAEELYRNLRSKLSDREWSTTSRVLSAKGPGEIDFDCWNEFTPIRTAHFNASSASAIANVVSPLLGTELAPSSILSFNAEPLLFGLINHSTRLLLGPSPQPGALRKTMDVVTRSTSNIRPTRIPYVYCHGLLPVPGILQGSRQPFTSEDKLVFSESQYLALSNQAYSWQSSTFLSAATTSHLVFIGVSLSDPNMRRWLSWAHSVRQSELLAIDSNHRGDSTRHWWLRTRPRTTPGDRKHAESWIESSVSHLGVRIVWLDGWDDIEMALSRMLGE